MCACVSDMHRACNVQAASTSFLRSDALAAPPPHAKHIEVLQGECAGIDMQHESTPTVSVATVEATTCCAVLVRCTRTRKAFLAHLDSSTPNRLDHNAMQAALHGMQQVCKPLQM